MTFPGGATFISIPDSRTLPGSVSFNSPLPPPKSSTNICLKFSFILAKLSLNISFMLLVSSEIRRSSSDLDFVTSDSCPLRNSYLSETSLYSSIASVFTVPNALIFDFNSFSRLFAAGTSSSFSALSYACATVIEYASQSWLIMLSLSRLVESILSFRRDISAETVSLRSLFWRWVCLS